MQIKSLKRILSAMLAVFMLATMSPIVQTAYALSDEDITATVELGKGFNLLEGKTFEAGNLKSAPIFKSMENMNPTKTRLGDVESKMTYITSMSSYLDNTHTDISVDVGVSTEILMAKTDIKAKFGFKGSWDSSGSTNTSRLILEILAKAYKYSMNINQGNPWAKDESGSYVTLNDKFAKDLMNMDPKVFFNTYGTHIVTQYDAGGEAYTAYEGTDTSNSLKSEFDIETNAEVGVTTKKIAAVNVAVSASGGEKHESEFSENKKQTSMRVRGGDPFYSSFEKIISGDADGTVKDWLASMYGKDDNTGSTKSTMIKSDNMQLFAMWDLLAMDKSQSHTTRIEELKKYYMENVEEELIDMYQEFIYGIPTNFADSYSKINTSIVVSDELESIDVIPEGFNGIRTEDDLMKMNGNQNYILLNDIEITDDFIHAAVDYKEFRGIFDGNGHTISGLKLIDTKGKYVGLFPLINAGAVIKNLIIRDAEIEIESKEGETVYAGIICGSNTDGLSGGDLGKIMDVRIEDSSITIKGGAGTTYLGGVVGYADSRNDNDNNRAVQRVTIKDSHIINEREGENSAVGAVTGYHKGVGGRSVLRVASYYNEVSSAAGYVGGIIGRSAVQNGSYVFGASEEPIEKGYIGHIDDSEGADYSKIFVMGEEDFGFASPVNIFKKCDEYLVGDEADVWTYDGTWDELPEPVFDTTYPYLIVHAPGGITAFKDATLGTNDITVYYAADPADSDTYEDITDYVNYFYDFSELGTTTVAAVYGNKTIEFEVEVLENVVTDKKIVNTGKTEYQIGDVFTIEDFVGQLIYSNGFTENVFMPSSEFVVTIPELEGNKPIVSGEYVMDYEIDSADVIVKYDDIEFIYEISVAEADPEGKIQFKANSVKTSAGHSFAIDVYMVDNPGITALKANLEFDEDVFELKNVTNEKVFEIYTDSREKGENGNVVYASPFQMYWSDPQAEANNTYNGDLVSFEFDVKNTEDLGDKVIRFNFVEAYDKDGTRIGGASSKFNVEMCEVKVGDIDGSARVNVWDAVLLSQHYRNIENGNLFMDASDVNYDGTQSSVDATYLNRYVVGLYGMYGVDGIPGRYKVNFKGNGFEDYTKYLTVGDEIPAPPVEDEKSFRGWYDNPDFEGDPITEVGRWTGGEFTLWAKVGYPIYYNLSSRRPEDFINYDELPTWYYCDEENPFKFDFTLEADGLTFKGWKDSYYEIPEEGFTKMPGAFNLTPQYIANTYDIYAHIYLEGQVDIVEKIGTYEYTMLSNLAQIEKRLVTELAPSVQGYVGGSVYKDPEFKEICGVNSNYISTPYLGNGKAGDFHLYYKYEPMKYNITFDWGYEDAPHIDGIVYEYGGEGFKLPTEIPSRPGYSFVGWNIVYRNMYGVDKNLPVTTAEYNKYWLLENTTGKETDITFIAQWMADTSSAAISLINPLTGLSERYAFDITEGFVMPEGTTDLLKVNDVYYRFDGWYDNAACEGEEITSIPANSYDANVSKYYSKWVETTTSTIVVHDKSTEDEIDIVVLDPGSEYIFPDAEEYVKKLRGDNYISGKGFYIKEESNYTLINSLVADFTEIHVYVDVLDVSNMVHNIFTVSNYKTTVNGMQLGVKVDGVTHLFDTSTVEKTYTIYTPSDKITTIEVLNRAYNSKNDRADVKYRAEYRGNVVEKERQIRYADKYAGRDRLIYTPIIKDKYTLDLYMPIYKAHKMYISDTTYDFVVDNQLDGLELLEGYPTTVARGDVITLPVLDDLEYTEYGGDTMVDYMNECNLTEEEKSTLKLKFIGWFERPYYSKKNEQPITEIDTSLIGQDIQLYAIFEPEAMLKNDGSYSVVRWEDCDIIKMIYVSTGNPKEVMYDTSEIENGRLVKAMPVHYYAPSFLVKGTFSRKGVDHPYISDDAVSTCLYNGGAVNSPYNKYNPTKNTTGYEYFYTIDDKVPSYYVPDLSLEE